MWFCSAAAGDRIALLPRRRNWPTYHGDSGGNRYTTLTQITKANVSKLATRWMFPMPNVTLVETTPVVVEGIMYISSANEAYALDAGSGRHVWHFRRARTAGIAGNAALGFNRGVAVSGNRVFDYRQCPHDCPRPFGGHAGGNRNGGLVKLNGTGAAGRG